MRLAHRGHFIRPLGKSSIPSTLVSLAVSSHRLADERRGDTEIARLSSWHAYVRRRSGDGYSHPSSHDGKTAEEWWSLLESLAVGGRTVTVVAHHAETCWTLLGGWSCIESGRINFGSLQRVRADGEIVGRSKDKRDRCAFVVGNPTTIITHRIAAGKATWIAVGNYVAAPLSDLADAVGISGVADSAPGVSGAAMPYSAEESARVVGEWIARLVARWHASDSGPWRPTAAMLGHSLWRRRHYTHPVLEHADPIAAELERESLFGGRASVWFWGAVGRRAADSDPFAVYPSPGPYPRIAGPAIHIDVRSMYPTLLRDHQFPVQLHKVTGPMTVDELAETLEWRSCIARVHVDHAAGEMPYRTKTDTRYPVGQWLGAFAEPELRALLAAGEIQSVEAVAIYGRAPAFASLAGHLLDARMTCRLAGDKVGESVAKLTANAFAGKFAARGGGWQSAPNIWPERWWGDWIERDADAGTSVRCRSFGGIVQQFVERSESPVGSPAIFSHLTSLGRCYMRRLRECAGPRRVYHQDTDGIWCHPDAVDSLVAAGYVFGDDPGNLRIDAECDYVQFLSPKHYCYDGQWVLSGIAAGWHPSGDGTFADVAVQHASGSRPTAPPEWVSVLRRRVKMFARSTDQRIDASGWSRPSMIDPTRPDPFVDQSPSSLFD
jgi:hypothetical protein